MTNSRLNAIRVEAARLAVTDIHLNQAGWRTDGDIVSCLADQMHDALTEEEADFGIETYDSILEICEISRV